MQRLKNAFPNAPNRGHTPCANCHQINQPNDNGHMRNHRNDIINPIMAKIKKDWADGWQDAIIDGDKNAQ